MKYQHENPNIEIINKNLWAVRFALIPYIPQISWKPDPGVPIEKVPFQLSPSGIVVLNKDFSFYPYLKQGFQGVMKLKPRQLKMKLAQLSKAPQKSANQVVYLCCLQGELTRRKISNGGGS